MAARRQAGFVVAALLVLAAILGASAWRRGGRPGPALAASGWRSLLFAVVGLATYVAAQGSDPICLG
jgi:hypothetical protein